MKLLLPVLAMMSIILVSCGPSEDERKAAQAENERKLNEIISKLQQVDEKEIIQVDTAATEADSVSVEQN